VVRNIADALAERNEVLGTQAAQHIGLASQAPGLREDVIRVRVALRILTFQ